MRERVRSVVVISFVVIGQIDFSIKSKVARITSVSSMDVVMFNVLEQQGFRVPLKATIQTPPHPPGTLHLGQNHPFNLDVVHKFL